MSVIIETPASMSVIWPQPRRPLNELFQQNIKRVGAALGWDGCLLPTFSNYVQPLDLRQLKVFGAKCSCFGQMLTPVLSTQSLSTSANLSILYFSLYQPVKNIFYFNMMWNDVVISLWWGSGSIERARQVLCSLCERTGVICLFVFLWNMKSFYHGL